MCFDLVTKISVKATRCFKLHVGKCRYCAQQGESLKSLAESYFTDWLQLWAANTNMNNPYEFKKHQLINIGALYSAKLDESLALLARRFRSDVRSLLVCMHACMHTACIFNNYSARYARTNNCAVSSPPPPVSPPSFPLFLFLSLSLSTGGKPRRCDKRL